jgi:hypothetical protein
MRGFFVIDLQRRLALQRWMLGSVGRLSSGSISHSLMKFKEKERKS